MRTNMGRQLVARFAERMAPQGATDSIRPDLFLADWEKVGRNSAKILVGWKQGLREPTQEALDNFVLSSFEGKLKFQLPTLRVFPESALVTCVVSELCPTRRLADANTSELTKISPTRYMEVRGSRNVWEVREGEDGTKHLVMLQKSNLEQLLEERRRSLRVRKGNVPTFDAIHSGGVLPVDVGDKVKFYYKGLLLEGRVKTIKDDSAKIESGGSLTSLKLAAVVDMVQKDPRTIDDQKDRIRAYWIQIYGKEYVDKWLGKAGE